MNKDNFEIRIDLIRNIPFTLDALFEIGIGIIFLLKNTNDRTPLFLGLGFIFIGIIQFIRKIKTFQLTDSELIVKRPLFPFAIAEERFKISKVKEIKFINIKGRFGGKHINVETSDKIGSFRIETAPENIDEFEENLKARGITPIRDGM